MFFSVLDVAVKSKVIIMGSSRSEIMKPILIAVVGPSCSGKSTVAAWLSSILPDSLHVELDDFFIDMNKRTFVSHGFKDMDRPSNLKFRELYRVLKDLKSGRSARMPHYSKKFGRCVGYTLVSPKPIIIVEGYLLFYRKYIADLCDFKIFMNISERVQFARRETTYHSPPKYVREVVIPVFRKYGVPEREMSDVVIDASKPLHQVEHKVLSILQKEFPGKINPTERNW